MKNLIKLPHLLIYHYYPMNIPFSLCMLFVDPSRGKIDKHSLSQQTLMELLIEGITENTHRICGNSIEREDISKWKGVKVNESEKVYEIYWACFRLAGSIELKWLPLSSEDVNISSNRLSGTADLTSLPDRLVFLSLSENDFEGTIDLTQLPCGLIYLYLYSNGFHGSTDFSQLPKSLVSLSIRDTQLEGEIFDFDPEGFLTLARSKVNDMRMK